MRSSYFQPHWDIFRWEVGSMLPGSVVHTGDGKSTKESEKDLELL